MNLICRVGNHNIFMYLGTSSTDSYFAITQDHRVWVQGEISKVMKLVMEVLNDELCMYSIVIMNNKWQRFFPHSSINSPLGGRGLDGN